MTIANKIIPAFYVVDIEGSAATLENLIGSRHRIKKISISSADMKNDLDAYAAMAETIETFAVIGEKISDELKMNPEFFPTAPPIEITPEMEELEAKAAETEEQLEEQDEHVVACAITRRFDEWGDFVSLKREIIGDCFTIKAKVAVHPRRYVLEKNIEKLEHKERLHGQGYGDERVALH